MNCYITSTSSMLPGRPISNDQLTRYMGTLNGEEETRAKILRMNGIQSRHYALTSDQSPTHDLYAMGAEAGLKCLHGQEAKVSYLSAGSTNTPLIGPGLSSLLHDRLAKTGLVTQNVEINSNSGICTASAQSLVNAVRAVKSGEHKNALSIGVEQPSSILKSTRIQVPDDRHLHDDIRTSKWFMSVFLRSMLSDGAGAILLSQEPHATDTSFKVDWTYSRSFANETPLCMKLENESQLLSQDVGILSQYMKPCVRKLMQGGLGQNNESLSSYKFVLPHLSSYFFKRYMLGVLREFSPDKAINHWTNLQSRGNTGAASIYIILDEFKRSQQLESGDKLLLFIPESGQFNFVLVSLTVV